MAKAIYFDMDGTIADLYGVVDWLDKLQNSDVSPYVEAVPLVDMRALANVLDKFVAAGFVIGVISWTAKDGNKEYNKAVRKAKKDWLAANMPQIDELHVVKYGTPKHRVANIKGSILVDDNADVRAAWEKYNANNSAVDATDSKNLVANLARLLAAA
jgi:5'(3')-deoxyribonucleotidase